MTITANFAANLVDGTCGASHGATFVTAPTTNLCTTGAATTVTGSGPWSWTCAGSNGGNSNICSAAVAIDVAISLPNTPSGSQSAVTTILLTNHDNITETISSISITGNDASQFFITPGGATPCASLTPILAVSASCTLNLTFSPTSIGNKSAVLEIISNSPTSPVLRASLSGSGTQPVPIDGVCGDSSGKYFNIVPTENFCSVGTASTIAGIGPWSWTCAGSNGGNSSPMCSANKAKPGDCNLDGSITIAEVQSAINMFLGLKTAEACVDVDSSNSISIAEVQKTINSFLGL